MVRGDRLRREKREPGDPVPGEVRDDARRHPGIRPFHLRAPAVPHRQRHHHVAQEHRDIDRGVRHQREPERHRGMREHVQGQREHDRDRLPEYPVADLHRQRGRVQRDDLAGPAHRHVHLRSLDAVGRTVIAGTGAARPEPLPPGFPQRPESRHRDVRPVLLGDVLADQDVLVHHAGPGPVPGLLPDREDRLAYFLGDAGMPAAGPHPPPVDAPGRALVLPRGRHPLERPLAHLPQPQQHRLLSPESLQFGGLGPPPLPQRRGPRVIAGAGLPGPRAQRVPAAEPGLGLQQVRDPHPHDLPLVIGQIVQDRRLPGRTRRHRGIIVRDGLAVGMMRQPPDAPPPLFPARAQQHTAVLGLDGRHRPLRAAQQERRSRRQLQEPGLARHHLFPPASQTSDVSPSGRDRSVPSRRHHSR
jgi:hypothetical protein